MTSQTETDSSPADSLKSVAPAHQRSWFRLIADHPITLQLWEKLDNNCDSILHASIAGRSGSAGTVITAAGVDLGRTILYVVAHIDEADEALDELTGLGLDAVRFPALEVLPGETNVSPDLVGERLAVIRRLLDDDHRGSIIIAPIPALMQMVPTASALDDWSFHLKTGDERGPAAILDWLDNAGYQRAESVEQPGEFAVRGGLIDIFPATAQAAADSSGRGNQYAGAVPVRLDYFGDELESIREVDLDTMASDRRIDEIHIVGASIEQLLTADENHLCGFWEHLPDNALVVLRELLEITEQGRGYFERAIADGGIFGPPAVFKSLNTFPILQIESHSQPVADPERIVHLPFESLPDFAQETPQAVDDLTELAQQGIVFVLCANDGELDRFRELLYEHNPQAVNIHAIRAYLHRGFIWRPELVPDAQSTTMESSLAIVPYHEWLHRFQTRRRFRKVRAGRAIDSFVDLKPGDFVVHRDHGIAKFAGLMKVDKSRVDESADGAMKRGKGKGKGNREGRGKKRKQPDEQEYLTLEFAGSARLHVPASKIDLIQKYVGGFDGKPPLSHFGGKKWSNQKDKVAEAVRDLAAEMLRLQAAREHLPGIRFPDDTTWQKQFEAEFPYEETEDQLGSLVEIKKDMREEQPMDRLLCGDVGFGKTELAVRAAFKAAEYGKQVAVLVPTTVLAEQHGRVFKQRFRDYPFRVGVFSRFNTIKKTKALVNKLRTGQIDIAIGTHRLLSKDIRFADLGLVIIDEEQRFGVEHKQRLLTFRTTADVLTLTATPIPRTLHMSLLGLRDISSLTTAPLDRRAVVTEVIPFNEQRIKRAIERELSREGQVFFIHNRVYNIQSIADRIGRLVPDARIIVGHGQMPDRALEQVMVKFINHQADILVATTIIESGIDIPNANTMFINAAENFGLADLHQLRGRVGRYKHRAYCYLMTSEDKALSSVAVKRLKAIEEYSMLGAGFKIAMRDLEIRGAGNLLGPEQSGHIAVVGYEMYCQLLDGAVHQLKNEPIVQPMNTEVELKILGSIPNAYIPADMRRLEAYRRISQSKTVEELEKVESELTDAYGSPPHAVRRLLELAEIRIRAAGLDIKSIARHDNDIIFITRNTTVIAKAMSGAKGTVRIVTPRRPDQPPEVYYRPPENYFQDDSILHILRKRLKIAGTL